MARKSAIEWLEGGASWNFLYGCTKVAQGCAHCFAERVIPRLGVRGVGRSLRLGSTMPASYTGKGSVIVREDHLEDPLRWTKGVKVFVNSLADTFHEDVPLSLLDRTWLTMARCPQHTFIVLTKRPGRMADYLASRGTALRNVWVGASAATQDELDGAVGSLRAAPAALRLLSLEPLIAPVDVRGRLDGIGWVIVGGESGRLARPCEERWVAPIVKACRAARVPVFVKQMGAWWASQLKLATGPNALDTKGNEPSVWPAEIRVREVPRG